MTDLAIYGPCEICGRRRLMVRKRLVRMPVGGTAKSQKKMCGDCFSKVKRMLEHGNR